MKRITQKELANKIAQTLGKVLYINSHGVTCDANWQIYSIFIMTGRDRELLEMFNQIDIQYNRLVELNEKKEEATL